MRNASVSRRWAELAVLGLIGAGCNRGGTEAARDSKNVPDTTNATAVGATLAEPGASARSDCCMGKNPCKGKGGCAVPESHACQGQNECAGRGGCRAHCPAHE